MTNVRFWPWLAMAPLALVSLLWSPWLAAAFALLFLWGLRDFSQRRHAVLRNYPLLGHLRFLLEYMRPEMRQYFLEDDEDKHPFSRNQRALVYQRAKRQNDKRGFGTLKDLYSGESSWLCHSAVPRHADPSTFRIEMGGPDCRQPYSLSVFNISAMSFGSLSKNAILALNGGAKRGGFAHDTGEGSISPHHRAPGGDLIWEIGSGYFGCRDAEGRFSPERFKEQAASAQVKMIEIKLSQGAKPGHGGVLPAAKVSEEIAATRGVPMGQDCISPASHSEFSTPKELLQFIARLRELSGGKPVGFKLCIGHPTEFFGIAKAMLETGITPDFIVVDGAEGGTGAAPAEFADHVGMPLRDGLRLVHNTLFAIGLRQRIKVGASGKIVSSFDLLRVLALGADWGNSARGFMFALGCLQSLSCHTDECPTGVATQDPIRQRALVVPDKATRVANFHNQTVAALAELVGAAGLTHPSQVRPGHLMTRDGDGRAVSFARSIDTLSAGCLATVDARADALPEPFRSCWGEARADRFAAAS